MTRERWQQVCAVFAAAVRCEPAQRAELIGETCGADGELRRGRPPSESRRHCQPGRFPDGSEPGEPRVPGAWPTDAAATPSRDGDRLPPLPLSDRA